MLSRPAFFKPKNKLDNLPGDTLILAFHFLETVELLFCAGVSHEWNRLALNIANERFDSYTKLQSKPESVVTLQWKAQEAMSKELSVSRSTEDAEKKLANRAFYLLQRGAKLHAIIKYAAEYGHPEIFTILLNNNFNLRSHGKYIVRTAAKYNQPAVIQFMDRNDSYFGANSNTLFDSNIVYEAIARNSAEALQALGNAGIDFTESKNQNNLPPLYNVLDLSFAESPEKMQHRFKMFEAMLKTGSFPKEGKRAFLAWFSDRVTAVTPGYSFDDFALQLYSKQPNFEKTIQFILDQTDKVPGFITACQNLEKEIIKALDEYEKIYLRCKEHVKKAIAAQKKPAHAENMTELTTFRKTLT